MRAYSKAIELNQNYSEAYFNKGITERIIIGNCLKVLNSYEKSIELYDKAIELNPQYSKAYNNRGTYIINIFRIFAL